MEEKWNKKQMKNEKNNLKFQRQGNCEKRKTEEELDIYLFHQTKGNQNKNKNQLCSE